MHEPATAEGEAALPATALPAAGSFPNPATRRDGWTGECMAIFCETLADTAVVAEACEAARKSTNTAYALRRRNPFFAAAWDAALAIARERLADTLLARSVEGNIEQIWRDGELVGERHVIDNRLGLAILRRLDRLAETGTTASTRGERTPASVRPADRNQHHPGDGAFRSGRGAPAPRTQPFDWEMMVAALRSGEPDDIAAALALVPPESHETHETHGPPVSLSRAAQEPEEIDLSDRCWLEEDGVWMTSFPPPADFTGYESCEWGDPDSVYDRECTPQEIAILEADSAALRAHERSEEEALRDQWFAVLEAELDPSRGQSGQDGVGHLPTARAAQ